MADHPAEKVGVHLNDDYDDIDLLIDTDPIALGERCRKAEAQVRRLRETLDRLDRLHNQHLRELAALPCLGSANGCYEAKALLHNGRTSDGD